MEVFWLCPPAALPEPSVTDGGGSQPSQPFAMTLKCMCSSSYLLSAYIFITRGPEKTSPKTGF